MKSNPHEFTNKELSLTSNHGFLWKVVLRRDADDYYDGSNVVIDMTDITNVSNISEQIETTTLGQYIAGDVIVTSISDKLYLDGEDGIFENLDKDTVINAILIFKCRRAIDVIPIMEGKVDIEDISHDVNGNTVKIPIWSFDSIAQTTSAELVSNVQTNGSNTDVLANIPGINNIDSATWYTPGVQILSYTNADTSIKIGNGEKVNIGAGGTGFKVYNEDKDAYIVIDVTAIDLPGTDSVNDIIFRDDSGSMKFAVWWDDLTYEELIEKCYEALGLDTDNCIIEQTELSYSGADYNGDKAPISIVRPPKDDTQSEASSITIDDVSGRVYFGIGNTIYYSDDDGYSYNILKTLTYSGGIGLNGEGGNLGQGNSYGNILALEYYYDSINSKKYLVGIQTKNFATSGNTKQDTGGVIFKYNETDDTLVEINAENAYRGIYISRRCGKEWFNDHFGTDWDNGEKQYFRYFINKSEGKFVWWEIGYQDNSNMGWDELLTTFRSQDYGDNKYPPYGGYFKMTDIDGSSSTEYLEKTAGYLIHPWRYRNRYYGNSNDKNISNDIESGAYSLYRKNTGFQNLLDVAFDDDNQKILMSFATSMNIPKDIGLEARFVENESANIIFEQGICPYKGGSFGTLKLVKSGNTSAYGASSVSSSDPDLGNLGETDYWKDCVVEVIGGAGSGQMRVITASTTGATCTMTVNQAWSPLPSAGDDIRVTKYPLSLLSITAVDANSITSSTALDPNMYQTDLVPGVTYWIYVTEDTVTPAALNQKRKIIGNGSNVINLDTSSSWSTTPSTSAKFSIMRDYEADALVGLQGYRGWYQSASQPPNYEPSEITSNTTTTATGIRNWASTGTYENYYLMFNRDYTNFYDLERNWADDELAGKYLLVGGGGSQVSGSYLYTMQMRKIKSNSQVHIELDEPLNYLSPAVIGEWEYVVLGSEEVGGGKDLIDSEIWSWDWGKPSSSYENMRCIISNQYGGNAYVFQGGTSTLAKYNFISIDRPIFFTKILPYTAGSIDGIIFIGNNLYCDDPDETIFKSESGGDGMQGGIGSATSNTITSEVDYGWEPNAYIGYTVRITNGPNKGQLREIIGNTADSLTVSQNWDNQPTSADNFSIEILGETDFGAGIEMGQGSSDEKEYQSFIGFIPFTDNFAPEIIRGCGIGGPNGGNCEIGNYNTAVPTSISDTRFLDFILKFNNDSTGYKPTYRNFIKNTYPIKEGMRDIYYSEINPISGYEGNAKIGEIAFAGNIPSVTTLMEEYWDKGSPFNFLNIESDNNLSFLYKFSEHSRFEIDENTVSLWRMNQGDTGTPTSIYAKPYQTEYGVIRNQACSYHDLYTIKGSLVAGPNPGYLGNSCAEFSTAITILQTTPEDGVASWSENNNHIQPLTDFSDLFNITGDILTIEMWLNATAIAAGETELLRIGDPDDPIIRLFLDGTAGTIDAEAFNDSGSSCAVSSSISVSTDYYVMVCLSTSTGLDLIIQSAGGAQATDNDSWPGSVLKNDTYKVTVGDSATALRAKLDGIKISNITKTTSEFDDFFNPTTLIDSSSNANDMALSSAAALSYTPSGVYKSALLFDGSSNANVSSSSELQINSTATTIGFCIKRIGSSGVAQTLMQKGTTSGTDAEFRIHIDASNYLNVECSKTGAIWSYTQQSTSTIAVDSSWYSYVIIIDPSSGITIIKDGVDDTGSSSGTAGTIPVGSSSLYLGSDPSSANYMNNSMIDSLFMIKGTSWTTAEAHQMYLMLVSNKALSDELPYRFNSRYPTSLSCYNGDPFKKELTIPAGTTYLAFDFKIGINGTDYYNLSLIPFDTALKIYIKDSSGYAAGYISIWQPGYTEDVDSRASVEINASGNYQIRCEIQKRDEVFSSQNDMNWMDLRVVLAISSTYSGSKYEKYCVEGGSPTNWAVNCNNPEPKALNADNNGNYINERLARSRLNGKYFRGNLDWFSTWPKYELDVENGSLGYLSDNFYSGSASIDGDAGDTVTLEIEAYNSVALPSAFLDNIQVGPIRAYAIDKKDNYYDTDTGTAKGTQTSTTLQNTDASWDVNRWSGHYVTITFGNGKNQSRLISSNTSDTLTISEEWDENPVTLVSEYEIAPYSFRRDSQSIKGGEKNIIYDMVINNRPDNTAISDEGTCSGYTATNELQDTTKSWGTDDYKRYAVVITSGTGAGQWRVIASNNSDTLTLEDNWTTNPDATSEYFIKIQKDRTIGATCTTSDVVFWYDDRIPVTIVECDFEGLSIQDLIQDAAMNMLNINRFRPSPSDWGKVSSATGTTITDTSKDWVTNVYQGSTITIIDGNGQGEVREVSSNTSDTITVTAWDNTPSVYSTYVIEPVGGKVQGAFIPRNSNIGKRDLYQKEIINGPVNPNEMWKHRYDGIIVNWNDGVDSGSESYGDTRKGKNVLTISNQLIQNRYLARTIAFIAYQYYSVKRRTIKGIKSIPLMVLEPMDEIRPIYDGLKVKDQYLNYTIYKIDTDTNSGISTYDLVQSI